MPIRARPRNRRRVETHNLRLIFMAAIAVLIATVDGKNQVIGEPMPPHEARGLFKAIAADGGGYSGKQVECLRLIDSMGGLTKRKTFAAKPKPAKAETKSKGDK